MDSLVVPPITERAGGDQLTARLQKFFPRKPARLPNPTYRKLRRGSAVGRIREKQAEYGQSFEVLPYNNNKAYSKDEETQIEEPTFLPDDDDSIQELPTSKETNHNALTKKTRKKDAHINWANKECSLSRASSHVINIQAKNETLDDSQVLNAETLRKTASTYKEFIEFCSREIVCPQEQRTAFAVKLYGVQAALLNSPFDFLSESTNSSKALLTFREAYLRFLPAMIWTGMFMLSSVYTIMVVWSLPFRLPMISILVLAQLFCLSILAQTASGFNIVCGTVRMSGILFASVGAVCFVILLVFLVMLVLFALWRSQYKEEVEMKGLQALR